MLIVGFHISAKINTISFLHNIHTKCAHKMTTILLFDYSQMFF